MGRRRFRSRFSAITLLKGWLSRLDMLSFVPLVVLTSGFTTKDTKVHKGKQRKDTSSTSAPLAGRCRVMLGFRNFRNTEPEGAVVRAEILKISSERPEPSLIRYAA